MGGEEVAAEGRQGGAEADSGRSGRRFEEGAEGREGQAGEVAELGGATREGLGAERGDGDVEGRGGALPVVDGGAVEAAFGGRGGDGESAREGGGDADLDGGQGLGVILAERSQFRQER